MTVSPCHGIVFQKNWMKQQIGVRHAIRLPIQPAPRLLNRLREVLRYKHYSLRTEDAYVYWVRFSSAGVNKNDRCDIRASWSCRGFAPFPP